MSDRRVTYEGPGAGFLLFLVFLVLKLCGVIDWSWWWVTCPLWIGFGVVLLLLVFAFVFAAIGTFVGWMLGER